MSDKQPEPMDGLFAVFNQHINDAGERARAVMAKASPKWLARVDAISLEGDGIMAIFDQKPNAATRRYVSLVTQFVNERIERERDNEL
jgi:class 3 adenylate cyclase